MLTISIIRMLINQVPVEHLFTTKDLLHCGTRGAVDQALNRLVKRGEISRIAPGVFVRPSIHQIETDYKTISMVKAHAKGKHEPKSSCPRCYPPGGG